MAQLLRVAQLGHPVLRQKTERLADFDEPTLQQLIDDMLVTVVEEAGVGLAAPQVYEAKRLFVMVMRPTVRYPHAPLMEPAVFINPQITASSDETEKAWEGCLSIPGIGALVTRPKAIEVQYRNREGKEIKGQYSEIAARVIQHEYDHLEGKVIFDRLDDPRDIMMEREYLRLASN